MKIIINLLIGLVISAMSTGCALVAPKYSPSMDNVQKLKANGGREFKVEPFTISSVAQRSNPISIRTNSMTSPYGNTYTSYIEEALYSELSLAKRHSKNADLEISGELLKNDVDASGFITGVTTIEVKFTVKDNGQPRYEQVKSIKHEFPSHFVGAIAIPNAVQSYHDAVQKLLALLYEDKAFVEASKH